MLKDFKAFLMRGNMVALAVAVVIGEAFFQVINSIVKGIISPLLGLVTGHIDFSNLYINLSGHDVRGLTPKEIADRGWTVLRYGDVITTLINFVIVAFVVFLILQWLGRYVAAFEAQAQPSRTELLLEEIRDILKKEREASQQ